MQLLDARPVYAASDLNDYLECKRLSELSALVAFGKCVRPNIDDPTADLLRRKGEEHEKAYLERLRDAHPRTVEFERPHCSIGAYEAADRATLEAMRNGAPVIYQATFFDGEFLGHADFLRRVPVPSDLGEHSYEVVDTKLGLNPKPYYLVQLCNYSEHVERLQGRLPGEAYVLLGNGEQRRFRLREYMAYYRRLKRRFLEFVANPALARGETPSEYPMQCKHCSICAWNEQCANQRRSDDHLSLVAWMRRDQIAKLEAGGIGTLEQLAGAVDEQRPSGMSPQTFAKLSRQASLQLRGRTSARPIYELLSHDPGLGFELLPPPAPGDVFFDMEGDPLFEPGRTLEYLFGCWMPDDERQYRAFWARSRAEEKHAFESFVDFIAERRRQFPDLHVYHYASYEKNALRRLAQQHATREELIDDFLRDDVLVDLFAVARVALAISHESYGLKSFERFYGFARDTVVKKGDESIVMFERWLLERDEAILDDIERYNRDDCRSTCDLRAWLLERRAEAIEKFGIDLPLRATQHGQLCHVEFEATCSKCVKRRNDESDEARRSGLERRLLHDVVAPQTEEQYRFLEPDRRTRYLLANLLAYHRREEKPAWWAYFDRCENVDRLLEFDRDAIAGLRLCDEIPARPEKRSFIYTYEFPEQPYKLGSGDDAENPRAKKAAGTIVRIDPDANRLELKTGATLDDARAIKELIPARPRGTKEQRGALARIGAAFLGGTLSSSYPATHDLLANREPRLVRGRARLQPEVVTSESVSAVVSELDCSYLFIQGPPGSGKSTIGSQVICDLLSAGKRVAVTSTSHKAIHNLLEKVEACMSERGGTFRGRYKHSAAGSEYVSRLPSPFIESLDENLAFAANDYQLAGGTGWLYSREELAGKFDYLFIDEAGQVSLADALANSLCAKNVVLLGDPSQLAQVSQGRHPLHADDSVLQHLLGESPTVAEDRGIFLNLSYRMHPAICRFISDAMYDGRLDPAQSTIAHRVITPEQEYAGLYFLGVDHASNGASSHEEACEIVGQVVRLLSKGCVIDSGPRGHAETSRNICGRDIVIVSPYNAQRRLIQEKLRQAGVDIEPTTGVRVGTVDKFQGQEAAIVFYSMATSSGEDVPRNVEFLFERNRFNVAISRARAASVLLCSPRLLDIRCRTPEQMALANLLCAFEERADKSLIACNSRRALAQ
ncbi:MAG: TM0106 family RecB-like putative nuclease [Candidatus Eremiobacteraeota bacterium]|nr:TM0106 family RecB-like putative nuclease [Candidatus Eremiobacteraeota bacterium]